MKVKAMRDFMQKLGERARGSLAPRRPRGQSLVIVAFAFIGIAVMVGLAVDGGILFASQAHLRRAVDAAAVAAATQMRVGQSPEAIQRFAYQFVKMNGVDPTTVIVSLYNYNNDPGGAMGGMGTDCHHAGPSQVDPAYDRYGLCEVPQRKLIRVEGRTGAQFAFMPLVGIISTTVTANAVAESASVDAVIVLDTSNSMGDDTTLSDGTRRTDTAEAVAACNAMALTNPKAEVGNCRPLMDAKEAAKAFVRRLYPDYDRVAIVNFDFKAHPVIITDTKAVPATSTAGFSYVRQIANPALNGSNQGSGLCTAGECDDDPALAGSQSTGIYQALDSVKLNYDRKPWLDTAYTGTMAMQSTWLTNWGKWNPLDYRCNWTTWGTGLCPGKPLTSDAPDPGGNYSALSTCTGCGIRVAGNLLKLNGRPSALWVIILLSDGLVNIADIPDATVQDPFFTSGIKVAEYPNGYCGVTNTPTLANPVALWSTSCVYTTTFSATTRICGPYHDSQASCPPGATWVNTNTPPYGALDYARDMIDVTALRVNCPSGSHPGEDCLANNGGTSTRYNSNEHPRGSTGPAGTNLAIYSIGLGKVVAEAGRPVKVGEALLRYMAAVGDDGDRVTDPCQGVGSATTCGNYYYAPSGAQLQGVFEDIAKRVFTRLSK